MNDKKPWEVKPPEDLTQKEICWRDAFIVTSLLEIDYKYGRGEVEDILQTVFHDFK